MSTKGRRFLLATGVLGAMLSVTAPVIAQGHPGGGGGGHAGGGGGHFGGGGHAAGGHVGGGGPHFAGGAHYGAVAGHYGGGAVAHAGVGYGGGFHGYYGGRPGYGYPGGGYVHGYSTGAHWGGGYWRGGYWPRAYYGLGYAWFLPVLPLAYATYWYGGVPYYYANDVYYTWNPDYEGYTATDPPPVSDSGATGSAVPPQQAAGPLPGAGEPPANGGQIFMYPRNGQSEEQQSADKRECQQWAAGQAGASNSDDYRRAMMACVEGRGYSAN